MKAYCVKCKEKREMKDPKKDKSKNGRWMMKATCPHCGTKMFRFISDEEGKKKGGEGAELQPVVSAGGAKKNKDDEQKGGEGVPVIPEAPLMGGAKKRNSKKNDDDKK